MNKLLLLTTLLLITFSLQSSESCNVLVSDIKSGHTFESLITVYDCSKIVNSYTSKDQVKESNGCAVEYFEKESEQAVIRITDTINEIDLIGKVTMDGAYATKRVGRIIQKAKFKVKGSKLLEIEMKEIAFPKKRMLLKYDLLCSEL